MKRWFTGVGKYVLIGIWIAQTGLVLLMCALLEKFHHIPFNWKTYLRIKLLSYALSLPFLWTLDGAIDFLESLYCPSKKFDRPQPVYSLPERLRREGRLQEALCAYHDLASQYPDLAKPFIGMMDIYDLEYHDNESVRKVYQAAVKTVTDKRERALLDRACRDMLKDETQEPLP